MQEDDIDASQIDPNGDRLERLASSDTDPSSVPRITGIDQELDRITHYEDSKPLIPGSSTWGAQCMRSPTLDDSDEYITDRPIGLISNVSLPDKQKDSTWDVIIDGSDVTSVEPHDPSRMQPVGTNSLNADAALLTPSLCHPHVHIDKAFLLAHPRYAHLQLEKGTFEEAMELTNQAKANFTQNDIIERGQRLIDESAGAGVSHMRVFVELDKLVGTKGLDAVLTLKRRTEQKSSLCIQVCAFAQLPLFSSAQQDTDGRHIRSLMEYAATLPDVAVLGSTPYVEDSVDKMRQNIQWLTELAIVKRKHLDFHLDYNLDLQETPMVWYVLNTLNSNRWLDQNIGKTVVLGHCTRLTLLTDDEWRKIRTEIGDLPVSFVGLPTSDLFMMRTNNAARGTLNVPRLIKDFSVNASIGMNNIGNAFTPQGCCDPLSLASSGVGVYQAGTERDASLLFECISTRARHAIGLNESADLSLAIKPGSPADLLLFGSDSLSRWRTRRSISEAVYLYDGASQRQLCAKGRLVCKTLDLT